MSFIEVMKEKVLYRTDKNVPHRSNEGQNSVENR